MPLELEDSRHSERLIRDILIVWAMTKFTNIKILKEDQTSVFPLPRTVTGLDQDSAAPNVLLVVVTTSLSVA